MLPLQSQTNNIGLTQRLLVQIEYGKYSKKRIRHKDFPRDMQGSDSNRVVGNPQQDISETLQDRADLPELAQGKDLTSEPYREKGSSGDR